MHVWAAGVLETGGRWGTSASGIQEQGGWVGERRLVEENSGVGGPGSSQKGSIWEKEPSKSRLTLVMVLFGGGKLRGREDCGEESRKI